MRAAAAAAALLLVPLALLAREPRARSRFVTANGVRLHYLDWGGKGETLLFLSGVGGTAHDFDSVARRFTDDYHVLALTRRGFGESEQPQSGYDNDTLVEDLRQFLDALKIKRVSLIGHSLAGAELTTFAGRYPDRVHKLVYWDAAYDRDAAQHKFMVAAKNPVKVPEPKPSDLESFDAYIGFVVHARPELDGLWSEALIAIIRATVEIQPDGTVRQRTPQAIHREVVTGAGAQPPAYALVKAPALAIYALRTTPPALDATPPELRAELQRWWDTVYRLWQRQSIAQFRSEVARGTVVELKNTQHLLFLQRRDEVVRITREFLRGKV